MSRETCLIPQDPERSGLPETRSEASPPTEPEGISHKETGIILDETLADGDEAEEKHACAQPDVGFQFLKQDIGGDLKDNVGDEEDGQGGVVLGVLKAKLLL